MGCRRSQRDRGAVEGFAQAVPVRKTHQRHILGSTFGDSTGGSRHRERSGCRLQQRSGPEMRRRAQDGAEIVRIADTGQDQQPQWSARQRADQRIEARLGTPAHLHADTLMVTAAGDAAEFFGLDFAVANALGGAPGQQSAQHLTPSGNEPQLADVAAAQTGHRQASIEAIQPEFVGALGRAALDCGPEPPGLATTPVQATTGRPASGSGWRASKRSTSWASASGERV